MKNSINQHDLRDTPKNKTHNLTHDEREAPRVSIKNPYISVDEQANQMKDNRANKRGDKPRRSVYE